MIGRLFHFLRAARLFARHQAWHPVPAWTSDDARAWTAFLGSPTGSKLNRIIQNAIMDANARAAQKALPFDCGWACGYRGLVANLTALTEAGPEPGANEEPVQGADGLDHLMP